MLLLPAMIPRSFWSVPRLKPTNSKMKNAIVLGALAVGTAGTAPATEGDRLAADNQPQIPKGPTCQKCPHDPLG